MISLKGRTTKEEKPSPDPAAEQLASTWTGGSALASKVASYALYLALGMGVLAFLVQILGIGSSTAAPITQHDDRPAAGVEATVGEYASRYVVTWLESTRTDHQALEQFVKLPSSTQLPDAKFAVANPAVADLVSKGNDLWTATIAATVTGQTKTGKPAPAARRYFQVSISNPTKGALIALALPSPIAGPDVASSRDTDYDLRLSTSDPVWTSTEQFMGALLAGSGDITRYLTPGADIKAITPAPYVGVRLSDLRGFDDGTTTENPKDGTKLKVIATVQLVNNTSQATTAQYALTLTARASRWEVTAIDLTPQLQAPTKPSPTPSSTSSSPTPLDGASATQEEENE